MSDDAIVRRGVAPLVRTSRRRYIHFTAVQGTRILQRGFVRNPSMRPLLYNGRKGRR